jgi:hypothetical protein
LCTRSGRACPRGGFIALLELLIHATVRIDAKPLELLFGRRDTCLGPLHGAGFGLSSHDLLACLARVRASGVIQVRKGRRANISVLLRGLVRQTGVTLVRSQRAIGPIENLRAILLGNLADLP